MQTKKYMSVLMSLVLLASVWLIAAPARPASASIPVDYGASASVQDPDEDPAS